MNSSVELLVLITVYLKIKSVLLGPGWYVIFIGRSKNVIGKSFLEKHTLISYTCYTGNLVIASTNTFLTSVRFVDKTVSTAFTLFMAAFVTVHIWYTH